MWWSQSWNFFLEELLLNNYLTLHNTSSENLKLNIITITHNQDKHPQLKCIRKKKNLSYIKSHF